MSSSDETLEVGQDIRLFVQRLASFLDGRHKVALGFECPLFVPLPDDPRKLTSARTGEGTRAWSAGAGCGALATGLTEVAWILMELRKLVARNVLPITTWPESGIQDGHLFLWEAFVTGAVKSDSHHGDAALGVEAFKRALPHPDRASAVTVERAYSLLGAALLRTGWSTDLAVLASPCIVIRATGVAAG